MLCARDRESDERIAARVGVSRRTLARWKRRPEFAAAVTAASLTRYDLRGELAVGLWWEGLGPALWSARRPARGEGRGG